jgi:DNA-binding NarL/FixJ family response regulator
MGLPGATSTRAHTSVDVGTVWVLARHLLVAQALTAALDRRMEVVRELAWEADGLDGSLFDAERDLLLVVDDLDSPTAVEAIRDLLTAAPARTVVMTGLPKGQAWGGLLAAGATEVISELPSIDDLAEIVARVCAGDPVIPRDERDELCKRWERHVKEEEELRNRMATLSPRELHVLRMLASGRRSAEIGETLGVTQSTVRTHIRSIRRKLDVDSQLRAVVIMHRLESRGGPAVPGMPSPRPSPE